jgi:tetratricopeptide (TPR) repeat protein
VEDLLNRLSTIEGFKVISRTSSERYRDRGEKSLPQIAKELGVSYIIEGSVQRDANKTRINVQLIDALRDAHVWSKYFDRDFQDIFKIQSEIAIDIAHELNTVLTPQQTTDIQRNRTENIKAYELYQLGRFYWNKRTMAGYQTSIGYFEKAIAEDPNYGSAYAGLADTYYLMGLQGHMDLKTGRDKAVTLALKALELDDRLAEAHNVLGSIYTYIDWSWEAAEKEYMMALKLNPNFSTVHHYYSEYLSMIGQHEKARMHVNKALELDPLSFAIRYVSVKLYFSRGMFQEALAENQRCNELNKDHKWPAFYDFIINKYLGNSPEALAGFKRYASIIGVSNPSRAYSIYQASGFNGLFRWGLEFSDATIHKAEWYAYSGDNEKALEMVEKAFQEHECRPEFAFLYAFRDLYSTPRFNAILQQMNLPVHLPATSPVGASE